MRLEMLLSLILIVMAMSSAIAFGNDEIKREPASIISVEDQLNHEEIIKMYSDDDFIKDLVVDLEMLKDNY